MHKFVCATFINDKGASQACLLLFKVFISVRFPQHTSHFLTRSTLFSFQVFVLITSIIYPFLRTARMEKQQTRFMLIPSAEHNRPLPRLHTQHSPEMCIAPGKSWMQLTLLLFPNSHSPVRLAEKEREKRERFNRI